MLEQEQKDYLTGFSSREVLYSHLERYMMDALSRKKIFTVALIDLDRFKKFNDKFGHLFGDEVLKYAASTLRLTLRGTQCYFFRYGGDEFVLLFPDKEPKEVFRLLRGCTHNFRYRPFLFNNKFYKVTFSSGIASFPTDEKTLEKLLLKADEAMYFSKSYGHNLITLAGKMKYLKLRNILLILGTLCIIALSLFVSYQFIFKDALSSTFRKIGSVQITTKPRDLDIIILKTGEVYEGRVLEETEDRVVFNLYLQQGEGHVVFKKSELSSISYGSEEPSGNEDE